MGKYKSVNDIAVAVNEARGVLTVPMYEVRDACGYQRLREAVAADISRQLEGVGLGFMPRKIPEDQNKMLRLFKKDSLLSELMDLMRSPDPVADKRIVAIFNLLNSGSEDRLRRIRKHIDGITSILDGEDDEEEEY